MENPLINFYNNTQTEISAAVILFNILFAFALGMLIVWVWRRTHKGLSYSQSYAFTIILLAPLSATVMMIVQNNLIGAFALLGAFSLIRFRTIIKETRDVAFLFFSLTAGVASGTNNYALGLVATLVISAITLWLYKHNFGSAAKTGFVLTIETTTAFSAEALNNLFTTYLRTHELLHTKQAKEGSEYAYSLHFKDADKANAFMEELRKVSNVTRSYLITGKELIEY